MRINLTRSAVDAEGKFRYLGPRLLSKIGGSALPIVGPPFSIWPECRQPVYCYG
jgi:hypothetical protein